MNGWPFASLCTTFDIVFTGTAIPLFETYATFIPIRRPDASTSGPPEYPGLTRASVMTAFSMVIPHHPPMLRFAPVMIPEVTLVRAANGFARARTNCPAFSPSESPLSMGVSAPSTVKTAMSERLKRPVTLAVSFLPSSVPMLTSSAPLTTWYAVTTVCSSQAIPEPLPWPELTLTTERPVLSAIRSISPEIVCSIPLDFRLKLSYHCRAIEGGDTC